VLHVLASLSFSVPLLLSPLFSLFTAPAPPESSPLSLHDALPIFPDHPGIAHARDAALLPDLRRDPLESHDRGRARLLRDLGLLRSEEHTSELQSLTNLVCRLLLEKKNKHPPL